MGNAQSLYVLDTNVANNWFSAIWMMTRVMKAAGWLYQGSGDSSSKDTSATATADLWGGNANPLVDAYPVAFNSRGTGVSPIGLTGPWIVLRGPDVIKLPIAAASSGGSNNGLFLTGESVTQATSGATGELKGYVFDASNGGWIVIKPRTGSWDGTHAVTGASSGASVTPTSIVTYKQEILFWKCSAGVVSGHTAWVVDTVASGNLFSSLMTAAGCTNSIAPGGGGTGNSFPSTALMLCGTTTGGTSPTLATDNWQINDGAGAIPVTTHVILAAANATPAAAVSADGTFWGLFSQTGSSTNAALTGLFLLDDGEPGDVSPYAWHRFRAGDGNSAAFVRLGSVTTTASQTETWNTLMLGANADTNSCWQGWVARGTGFATDAVSNFNTSISVRSGASSGFVLVQNNADLVKAQNHPATTKPQATDTMILWNSRTGSEMIKGRPRWMRAASLGSLYDTTDGKTWVCFIPNALTQNPAVYVGPWDGATVPLP